eukprot:6669451-Alexandrium_andersonii.AAC.1
MPKGLRGLRFRGSGPPSIPAFVGGFGIHTKSGVECTGWEIRGLVSRPLLGLRSSGFERAAKRHP